MRAIDMARAVTRSRRCGRRAHSFPVPSFALAHVLRKNDVEPALSRVSRKQHLAQLDARPEQSPIFRKLCAKVLHTDFSR